MFEVYCRLAPRIVAVAWGAGAGQTFHSGWKVPILVWCIQIILQYDVRLETLTLCKMEFNKKIETFFTHAKVSKVLNLDFFFCIGFLDKLWKEIFEKL